jgi:hypothetical protein
MPIDGKQFKELDEELQGIIIKTCKSTMKRLSKRRIDGHTLYRLFNLGNPSIDFVMEAEKVASWHIAEESKEVMQLLFKNYLFK